MEQRCQTIKETMQEFEEKNNEKEEENLIFGDEESKEIRMLGSWLDLGIDVANRIKRVGFLWSKVRPQMVKSRYVQQAIIVETCVLAGLLFDAAVCPYYKNEINRMQQWIDRRYRCVWSNKQKPPLITMERTHTNRQDIRNQLNIKTLQWKIEKRSLEQIGHVLRMDISRPVKAAVLGWSPALETIPKERTKTRTTPQYWRRLVKEAGIDLGKYTKDRKAWRKTNHGRMARIERWEKQKANKLQDYETVETRNFPQNWAVPHMLLMRENVPNRRRLGYPHEKIT